METEEAGKKPGPLSHTGKIEEPSPRLGRTHRKKGLDCGAAGDTTDGSKRMGGKYCERPRQTGLLLTDMEDLLKKKQMILVALYLLENTTSPDGFHGEFF